VLADAVAPSCDRLLVHARDPEKGQGVVDELESIEGIGEAVLYLADLSSIEETKRMTAELLEKEERLDVLVNNAGVGTGGGDRELSADGYELTFAVNYLAPYVLSRLLLPLLRAGAPSRIVNIASIGQAPLDFDNLMLEDGFSPERAYGQSKVALIMLTADLAEELDGSGVTANSLHPGTYMPTQMVRDAGIEPIDSLESGVEATMRLVEGTELDGVSGRFFNKMTEAGLPPQAEDPAARKRLQDISAKLTGL
jgi:NAD(P)-dependent dehydrogenase (short-subunit alcohol dehydrogenase family)